MRTTVCWFSFPLRYYVEAVSVSSYISPSIDEERQCKYVCACLCVSVYVSICLYMYAFTHVFIIHLVFAFCYEAFKGILLGILLPFYTQKIYSMISRSIKHLKKKKKKKRIKTVEKDLFPLCSQISNLSINSEPGLYCLLGRRTS